tara:strand:+ start:565 stop:735 length:171 start_codon:yes stop_codon:yes gene_type:complete
MEFLFALAAVFGGTAAYTVLQYAAYRFEQSEKQKTKKKVTNTPGRHGVISVLKLNL